MQVLTNLITLCTVDIVGLLGDSVVGEIKSSAERGVRKLWLMEPHKDVEGIQNKLNSVAIHITTSCSWKVSGETGTSSGALLADPLFSRLAGANVYLLQ